MFKHMKNSLFVASTNTQVKIVIQLIALALILIAALGQPEAAFAGPSWGNLGG